MRLGRNVRKLFAIGLARTRRRPGRCCDVRYRTRRHAHLDQQYRRHLGLEHHHQLEFRVIAHRGR